MHFTLNFLPDQPGSNQMYQSLKSIADMLLLSNLCTVIEGELDPSMYTMNPTVGDTTFLPTVTTTPTLEETPEPGGQGGQFPTLHL